MTKEDLAAQRQLLKELTPIIRQVVRQALAEAEGINLDERLPYYLTVTQAAKELKVSRAEIDLLLCEGALQAIDVSMTGAARKALRINRDSLRAHQARQAAEKGKT